MNITPESSFETLKGNVVSAISSYFPFEGKRQKLVLDNITVDDKLSVDDIRSQAEAKDSERTWGVPVVANISLVDKITGKVLDKKKATVATIPKLTSRYGFIVGGNEYQVDHLFRLKSGVYARVQENGELESEFNLAKKLGMNFSIHLDPKTDMFSFKYGTAHIPLYPVLKSMGVADDDLEHAWGTQIFNKNKFHKKNERALSEFYKRTSDDETTPAKTDEDLHSYVHHFFNNTALLPDTTKVTLGKSFTQVTGETLKLAANKILGVSRRTHEPDDRDSLVFKEIVSVEDFLPEKLTRPTTARNIKARLRQTVDHKKTVTEILSADLFKRPINDLFLTGDAKVIERSDQTNPIQMMSGHRKTTLFSDLGGIKNKHAVTEPMQVINPSHFGFLDPMHTPESERTGITLYLSGNARKNGKNLETPAFNISTGKVEYVNVPDFHTSATVLPDQVRWVKGKPVPISPVVKMKLPGGEIESRPFKEAKYVLPSAKGMFDFTSNLIPFLPTDQGNRVSMADKQMEQAISLKHREAPLVQSKTEDKHTFEKVLGSFSSTQAPVAGKVLEVRKDAVILHDGKKKHEVQIYNHFPLNDSKGMMHSEVVVKAGDQVKAGQLLADTNFTKAGHLAVGTNLRVGYMPYKGYNYEDGIVISETASRKLTSEHLHRKNLEIDPDIDITNKAKWHAFASRKATDLSKEEFDALDESGVIKVGTKVRPGAVLVAALSKNTVTKQGSALAALGSRYNKFFAWKDKSLTWDEDHVGEVVKVVKNPNGKGVKVYVKTAEPMVIGDKISGRHGNKGIVTQIIPDHEMPFTKDPKTGEAKPLEVLLNPSGVPTRINVGQILETAAGKIAEKTGTPYIVNNFAGPGHDYRAQVEKDLKAHGLNDEEHVFDPGDPNKVMGSVLVGPQYLMKLRHQVEKKLSVRGGGTTVDNKPLMYSLDRQPVKGGAHGGQGFGQLELYSMLAHGARHNIREMSTYKSDKQDDSFWVRIQQGFEPPPPQVPFSYKKFEALLKGAGINVQKEGTELRLTPLVDKEILRLANHGKNEITKGHLMLRSKDLREEKGGLFDPQATGGIEGDKWSFIRIAEPMPNPIFVGNRQGPIPTLLGLRPQDIDLIMAGKMQLNGKIGGHALKDALSKIHVDNEIAEIQEKMQTKKGTTLDRLNKKLKYLNALKEVGLRPEEAYMTNYLPILPPMFRPVVPTDRGDLNIPPLNQHYKNFSTINQKIKELDPKVFSDEHKNPLRESLWESFKALQAVGNYKPVYDEASGKRKLKGILDIIGGGGEGAQPKDAFFQSKLIKRRQNLSIRSTIIPEPNLHIDQVGLPKNAAMELYKPFVVAQLGKWGMNPLDARTEMKNGTEFAFKALEEVVKDRPILLKRDPALHKFSVMAFQPKLIEGKAIQIHPLVTGGFNADFDGDTMAGTVPLSREAVDEAKKMFPSQNLFSPTTGGVMYTPSQEAMLGLHLMSKWGGKKISKNFTNGAEVDKAADSGEIGHHDVFKLNGKETTLGRMRIAARLPKSMALREKILHDAGFEITKKTMNQVATELAKGHKAEFADSIDSLKDLGNEFAYRSAFSIGLKDLKPLPQRDGILHDANKEADKAKKSIKDKDSLDEKLVDIYTKATEKIDAAAKAHYAKSDNRLATMVYSGARGKPEQLRQMIAAPMLMQDATNRTIPVPVTKSYSEGLDVGDYWLAQHGARKGTLQRAQGTSEPGALSKEIINSTMQYVVTKEDCGTTNGVLMELGHEDIHDRYLAKPYKLKDGKTVNAGTLITPEIWSRLKNSKHDKVVVRSPLKCHNGEGLCAKCYGLNEAGNLHDIGTNIGVLAGQSLGEPAVQMAMDAFHSGGIAGGGRGAQSVGRFERLNNLLHVPKTLKNEATIARTSGKVTSVVPNLEGTGGFNIVIDGVPHQHRNQMPVTVKAGDVVKAGDPLTGGQVNPLTLLKHTDMPNVQNYLTNELYHGLYKKEGVRRRNVETVVRSITNLTKVLDPGHSDMMHGDLMPLSIVEEKNREIGAKGKHIHHKPILGSIEQLPVNPANKNWMARLNFQQLAGTLQQGVAQGWKSDLHGSHPIPGLAYGAEFGKPPSTKPKHVY